MEFNAKMNSMQKKSTTTATQKSLSYSFGLDLGFFSASFSASYSSKTENSASGTDTREYSLQVVVRVRQAPLPIGVQRLLDYVQMSVLSSVKQ